MTKSSEPAGPGDEDEATIERKEERKDGTKKERKGQDVDGGRGEDEWMDGKKSKVTLRPATDVWKNSATYANVCAVCKHEYYSSSSCMPRSSVVQWWYVCMYQRYLGHNAIGAAYVCIRGT